MDSNIHKDKMKSLDILLASLQNEAASPRCNSTNNPEVHHKRRDGGNNIDNAEVLCHECHTHTSTYGVLGDSPDDFNEATKKSAMKRAGGKCECRRTNCHDK